VRRVLVAVGVAATLVSGAAGVALGQPEGGRANVAISLVDAPDPVLTGGSVTYTATVQNAGPHRVDEAKVLLLFPQAASVDAVRANGWHCGPPAASVVCITRPHASRYASSACDHGSGFSANVM